jgi:hypothetical protein
MVVDQRIGRREILGEMQGVSLAAFEGIAGRVAKKHPD